MRRLVLPLLLAMSTGACSDSDPPVTPSPAPPNSTPVSIRVGATNLGSNAYEPPIITVSVGTLVSFVNLDNTAHTTVANAGTWTSPNIAPGARFNVTIAAAGSYPYHCNIHPGMTGTINAQ